MTGARTLCRKTTMRSEPRTTGHTLKVLDAILSASDEPSGSDISKQTKLPSGTLYPILIRLEAAKWLESRWEDVDPREVGRPRRRLYKVTALGASKARQAAAEINGAVGRLAAWA